MKIIIVGSGISGLSAAYEMSRLKNVNVELYEMKDQLGGLAKSDTYKNGRYTEHSWRGYCESYENLFDIMKNIKVNNKALIQNINKDKLILSNLNKNGVFGFIRKMSLIHLCKFIYIFSKNMLSGSERQQNELSRIKFVKQISFLNHQVYLDLISDLLHIGPDPALVSAKTVNDTMKLGTKWYHLGYPTQEGLIDVWAKYLKQQNVKIHLNHTLTSISFKNKKIQHTVFYNKINKKADYYIFALPPYALYKLFQTNKVSKPLRTKIEQLHFRGYHKELSFRLFFKKKIKLGSNLSLANTDWGIVLIPLHEYWFNSVKLGKDIQGVISGTCVMGYQKSSRTNKNVFNSNLSEIKEEIQYQLENNEKFNQVIGKLNNHKLSDYDYEIEIWKEWYNVPQNCKESKCIGSDTNEIYWTNTYQTYPVRLDQQSEIKNLFFCGVHTKTSVDVATMESAAESAKLASLELCKKAKLENNIFYYKHRHDLWIRVFQNIDNKLYTHGLPNILDCIIITIILTILGKVISKYIL